jgi:acyl-CoA dehydrogenase
LDTLKLQSRAIKDVDHYVLSGQKIWISTAQVADKMLLLARTAPFAAGGKSTEGLSLFYTALDRRYVEVREIAKMGRKAVDSNQLFIDGLSVPATDRIGEEGRGFEYLLHGLNPERILVAAEAIGLGRAALGRASAYAKERIVFGRPIGQNQGIQHPLAECWMDLEAADLMMLKAAWQYDQGIACGPAANAAKYLAAEAGFKACQTAIATHGGYGYAKEYHVERYFREIMIAKLAPVSPQLVLCFIAEKVLGLPRSY